MSVAPNLPELLSAVGTLIRSVAWPAVAVLFLWWFRAPIKQLLPRLRKGGPAEFYPPPAQAVEAGTTPIEALTAVELTPGMLAIQEEIKRMPAFQGPAPIPREQVLFRVLARVTTMFLYRETETYIWASQVAILEHLNAQRAGDALANLKARFYDPVAASTPALVANYPFEQYLSFLTSKQLVAINANTASITVVGIDYLAWRVSVAAPPRLTG